jgi:hypothetical protein
MGNHNRRENIRVVFETTADLKFSDRIHAGCRTRDLSLTGIFIIGVEGCRQGEMCEVTLHLSGGSSDVRLAMRGEIVRTEPQGLALHFFEIDLDSFVHLKKILYYNAADPDMMEENDFVPQN